MTKLQEFYREWRQRHEGNASDDALDEVAAAGAMMERSRLRAIAELALKKIPAAARVLYRNDIQKVRDILDGKEVRL